MIDLNLLFNAALEAHITNALDPLRKQIAGLQAAVFGDEATDTPPMATNDALLSRMTEIEAAVTTLQEAGPTNLSEAVVGSIVSAFGDDDALADRLVAAICKGDAFDDAVCEAINSNTQRVASAIEDDLQSDDMPSKSRLREMIGSVLENGTFDVSFSGY